MKKQINNQKKRLLNQQSEEYEFTSADKKTNKCNIQNVQQKQKTTNDECLKSIEKIQSDDALEPIIIVNILNGTKYNYNLIGCFNQTISPVLMPQILASQSSQLFVIDGELNSAIAINLRYTSTQYENQFAISFATEWLNEILFAGSLESIGPGITISGKHSIDQNQVNIIITLIETNETKPKDNYKANHAFVNCHHDHIETSLIQFKRTSTKTQTN